MVTPNEACLECDKTNDACLLPESSAINTRASYLWLWKEEGGRKKKQTSCVRLGPFLPQYVGDCNAWKLFGAHKMISNYWIGFLLLRFFVCRDDRRIWFALCSVTGDTAYHIPLIRSVLRQETWTPAPLSPLQMQTRMRETTRYPSHYRKAVRSAWQSLWILILFHRHILPSWCWTSSWTGTPSRPTTLSSLPRYGWVRRWFQNYGLPVWAALAHMLTNVATEPSPIPCALLPLKLLQK